MMVTSSYLGLMPHLPHSLAEKPGNSNFSWPLGLGVGCWGDAKECWHHLYLSRPQGALLLSPTFCCLLILCQKVFPTEPLGRGLQG